MSEKNENSKLLMAGAVGGIAGLLLGAYIWGKAEGARPISSKLKTILKIIEQLEEIDTEDAVNLKNELKKLLLNLNSSHGESEE